VKSPWKSKRHFILGREEEHMLEGSDASPACPFDKTESEDVVYSELRIRIQSVPHRKRITSPLQSPTG
jgi:hypothetical protein